MAEKKNAALWKPNKNLTVFNLHFKSFSFHVNKTLEHSKNPELKARWVQVLFMDFLEKLIPCHTE